MEPVVDELREGFKFILKVATNFASGLCARKKNHRRELSRQRLRAFDDSANLYSEDLESEEVVDESGVLSEDASCDSDCERCDELRIKRKTIEHFEKMNDLEGGIPNGTGSEFEDAAQ